MKELFEVVLQWRASQQQLVVQLVLAQHSEKLCVTKNNDKKSINWSIQKVLTQRRGQHCTN